MNTQVFNTSYVEISKIEYKFGYTMKKKKAVLLIQKLQACGKMKQYHSWNNEGEREQQTGRM